MKKASLLGAFTVLLSSPVLAGGSYHSGWMVARAFGLLLTVFLCSIIFWWTYLWMVQDKGKLFKRK